MASIATWYNPGNGQKGACGAYNSDSDVVVALPKEKWPGNCWRHVEIQCSDRVSVLTLSIELTSIQTAANQ